MEGNDTGAGEGAGTARQNWNSVARARTNAQWIRALGMGMPVMRTTLLETASRPRATGLPRRLAT